MDAGGRATQGSKLPRDGVSFALQKCSRAAVRSCSTPGPSRATPEHSRHAAGSYARRRSIRGSPLTSRHRPPAHAARRQAATGRPTQSRNGTSRPRSVLARNKFLRDRVFDVERGYVEQRVQCAGQFDSRLQHDFKFDLVFADRDERANAVAIGAHLAGQAEWPPRDPPRDSCVIVSRSFLKPARVGTEEIHDARLPILAQCERDPGAPAEVALDIFEEAASRPARRFPIAR